MEKDTFEKIRKEGRLLYEYVRGSQAHGLATETSDVDTGGVYIASFKKFCAGDVEETIADEKNDNSWFELGKFMELIAKSNPNALEALFVPNKCILYESLLFKIIKERRYEFLSKECLSSFGGYAIAQIKRARGLNKMIHMPDDMERKTPLDFCIVPKDQGSTKLVDWLRNAGLEQEKCGLSKLPNMPGMYGVYYDASGTFGYHGIIGDNSNELRLSSIPKGEHPMIFMSYNEAGYTKHCIDYRNWKEWKEKRNPVRYESNLHKNYDCYLDSETEFLTNKGWKKYDDIKDNDLLATFDNDHILKYEPFISRYDSMYTGKLFTLETSYTRCTVTPNHKLYVSHRHAKSINGVRRYLEPENNSWEKITVNDFLKKTGNYYVITNLINSQKDNKLFDDEILMIIGFFLSDGTLIFSKKTKEIKTIRIYQLRKSKGYDTLHNLSNLYKIGEYHFTKRKNRDEVTFDFKSPLLIKLVKECIVNGHYSYQKVMPEFSYSLSTRQFNILLKGMLLGDGYYKKNGDCVYYTSSNKLAIGLRTLLSINGYNAQVYGKKNSSYDKKYKSTFLNKDNRNIIMYQVFIPKNRNYYHI